MYFCKMKQLAKPVTVILQCLVVLIVIIVIFRKTNHKNSVVAELEYKYMVIQAFAENNFCTSDWTCFRKTKNKLTFFNPSILDDKYTLLKVAPFNFCIPNNNNIADDDEDFKIVLMEDKNPINVVSSAEDGRLFRLNNKIFCVYTSPSFNSTVKYIMHIFDFDKNSKMKLRYEFQKDVEKNWSPFIHEDSLYLSYTLSPHVVLKCDTESGECTKVYTASSALPHNIRGSSQTIFWEKHDMYIGIGHTTDVGMTHRVYAHYFYLMNPQPPFDIVAASEPFKFPAHFYDWKDNIQFCCGIFIKNGIFHVSYGIADCVPVVINLDENYVENMMAIKKSDPE